MTLKLQNTVTVDPADEISVNFRIDPTDDIWHGPILMKLNGDEEIEPKIYIYLSMKFVSRGIMNFL